MNAQTALEAIRARIKGEWDNPALVEFGALLPDANADTLDIIEAVNPDPLPDHARAMSKALLKVRPLGGSEMFSKVGEEYLADPVKCGEMIDQMRDELHREKRARILGRVALERVAGIHRRNFGRQTEKLADIGPIAEDGLTSMKRVLADE